MQLKDINNQKIKEQKLLRDFYRFPPSTVSMIIGDVQTCMPTERGAVLFDEKTHKIYICVDYSWKQITS